MADIQLTKHENMTFSDQALYLSGHAYLGCTFERCTLFVTNTPFYIEDCSFTSCNWRLEYDLLWGTKTRAERCGRFWSLPRTLRTYLEPKLSLAKR